MLELPTFLIWQNITSKFRVLSSVLQKTFSKVSPNSQRYLSVKMKCCEFRTNSIPFPAKSSSNPEVNVLTDYDKLSLSPLEAQSGIARQDVLRLAGQHANFSRYLFNTTHRLLKSASLFKYC